MPESAPSSGEIEYRAEGYLLRWSPGGIEIVTTEHHATQLRLAWDELFGLARRSGWRPQATDSHEDPAAG